MKLEDTITVAISYTQEEVNRFAELTGDSNPLHLDEAYASQTAFKKPIIHGMLTASIFSKILGMEFPGEGTIYRSQQLNFKRAMYVGEEYEARCIVVDVNERVHTAVIKTEIYHKASNKVTVVGEAFIVNKEKIG